MNKKLRELMANQDIYLAKKYIKDLNVETFKKYSNMYSNDNNNLIDIFIEESKMVKVSYDIYYKKGIYCNVRNILEKYGKFFYDEYYGTFVFELNITAYEKMLAEEEKSELNNKIEVFNDIKLKRARL